jgi:hypothetical protein
MPLYWLCYRHNNQISVVIEEPVTQAQHREPSAQGHDRTQVVAGGSKEVVGQVALSGRISKYCKSARLLV